MASLSDDIKADVTAVENFLKGVVTYAEGLGLKIVMGIVTIVQGLAPNLLVEFQAVTIQALTQLGEGATWEEILAAIKAAASPDLQAALGTLEMKTIQLLVALVQAL